jgi:hypothetical protein
MRHIIIATLVAPALASAQSKSCRTPDPKAAWVVAQRERFIEKPGSWSSDSLRTVLVSAVEMARTPGLQLGWALYPTTVTPLAHQDVIDALKALGAVRGSTWPLRSVVGVPGVRAMFYLAQRDTALLRIALHRMMEGGADEGLKSDIALLEDRSRLLAGRKQLYGTQVKLEGGKVIPYPIEDSSHVDLRREGADLPSLEWSVCNAKASIAK